MKLWALGNEPQQVEWNLVFLRLTSELPCPNRWQWLQNTCQSSFLRAYFVPYVLFLSWQARSLQTVHYSNLSLNKAYPFESSYEKTSDLSLNTTSCLNLPDRMNFKTAALNNLNSPWLWLCICQVSNLWRWLSHADTKAATHSACSSLLTNQEPSTKYSWFALCDSWLMVSWKFSF